MNDRSLGCLLCPLLGLSLSLWQSHKTSVERLVKNLLCFTLWGLMKKCSSFSESKHINEKRWFWSYCLPQGLTALEQGFSTSEINTSPPRNSLMWMAMLYTVRCSDISVSSHCLLDAHSILHPLLQQPKSLQILPSFFLIKLRWDVPLHSSLCDCLSLISLYEKCM